MRPLNTITKRNKDSVLSLYIRLVLSENSSDPLSRDLQKLRNIIVRALELPDVSRALLHNSHETDDLAEILASMSLILRFAVELEMEVTKKSCCCSGFPDKCSCSNCYCSCKHEQWHQNDSVPRAYYRCTRNCLGTRLLRTTVFDKAKEKEFGNDYLEAKTEKHYFLCACWCRFGYSAECTFIPHFTDERLKTVYDWHFKHTYWHHSIYYEDCEVTSGHKEWLWMGTKSIFNISESVKEIDEQIRLHAHKDLLESIVAIFPFFSIFDGRIADYNTTVARRCSTWIFQEGSVAHLSYLLTCIPQVDLDKSETKARLSRCLVYAIAVGDSPDAVKMLLDFGADRNMKVGVRPLTGQTSVEYLGYVYSDRQTSEEKNLELTLMDAYRLGYFRNDKVMLPSFFPSERSNLSIFKETNELQFPAKPRDEDMEKRIRILYDYRPTEEQRLASQLRCKVRIDSMFEYGSRYSRFPERFRRQAIDERYFSIWERLHPGLRGAVSHGQVELVRTMYPRLPADAAGSALLPIHLMSHAGEGGYAGCAQVVDHLSDLVRGLSPYTTAATSLHLSACEMLVARGHDVREPGLFDALLESLMTFSSLATSGSSHRLDTEYPAYTQGYPSAQSCLQVGSSAHVPACALTVEVAKQRLKDLMPEAFDALELMLYNGLDPTPCLLRPLHRLCKCKHLSSEEKQAW
jgi:hypothetical protein